MESPSATVSFRVDGSTVSGISIRDLTMAPSEKYKFFKALKVGMKSGRIQVRT